MEINKGDIVLAPVGVQWENSIFDRRSTTFYLAKKVEKTTKTQFTVDGLRYKKETGRSVGHDGGHIHFSDDAQRDCQLAEYEAFKTLVAQWNESRELVKQIGELLAPSVYLISEKYADKAPTIKAQLETLVKLITDET